MLTRLKLAACGLGISWALNAAGESACRLIWGSGDALPGLALYTASIYLLTYVVFVVPLVSCCRAAWQLRFWYLLLAASTACALLLCSLLFRASLHDMLTPGPARFWPMWFCECALTSVIGYLLLLRRAVRRAR